MTAPRVIVHEGVEVYAPTCPRCGSDKATRWIDLPSLAECTRTERGIAACFGPCFDVDEDGEAYPHLFVTDHGVAFRAREPERLAARLRELKAGGGW